MLLSVFFFSYARILERFGVFMSVFHSRNFNETLSKFINNNKNTHLDLLFFITLKRYLIVYIQIKVFILYMLLPICMFFIF